MSKDFEAEPVLAFDQRKPGKRRAYTTEQKRLVLEEARQPGNSLWDAPRSVDTFAMRPAALRVT